MKSKAVFPKRAMIQLPDAERGWGQSLGYHTKANGQFEWAPNISHALERLEAVGVNDVVINTHHLAETIENYYKNYQGANIMFSREHDLMETGGGVKMALSMLGNEPFFVINGDAFLAKWPYRRYTDYLLTAYQEKWMRYLCCILP